MRMLARRPRRVLVTLFALALTAPLQAHALPGDTYHASRARSGTPNGPTPAISVEDTSSPQLSLDGLKVAFSSDASNLVSGDTNAVADVFVYDMNNGRTERVSVASNGAQANGASHSPSISVDGRYVAFVSSATNLVPGDTNGLDDIFLRDRVAGTTRLVSHKSGRRSNGHSRKPHLSLFGRYVVYESTTRWYSMDTDDLPDVFFYDAQRNITSTVRAAPDPTTRTVPGTGGSDPTTSWRRTSTVSPTISYDGRFIAYNRVTYERTAATPSAQDVMIWDRTLQRNTRVNMVPWNGAAKVLTADPVISADGRFVAFEAWSVVDNVAGSDEALVLNPLDHVDVYSYDQFNRTVGLVSVNTWFHHGNAASYDPSISAGGQYISFTSEATNLVSGDTNGAPDVFVRDNVARTTSRMSVFDNAAQAAEGGTRPSISYEGRRVAFASTAHLASSAGPTSDVFWRDRRTDTFNNTPRFSRVPNATLDNMTETSIRVRAADRDGDPLRYGVLITTPPRDTVVVGPDNLPSGATFDPVSGTMRWTPTPEQAGRWTFVFWVDDPRGASDFTVWEARVRSLDQTLRCRTGIDRC